MEWGGFIERDNVREREKGIQRYWVLGQVKNDSQKNARIYSIRIWNKIIFIGGI